MSCDLAILSDVKLYMGITTTSDDTLLNMLIDQATNIITNELTTSVCAADYTAEVHNGDGSYTVMLDNFPIIEIYTANDSVQDVMYVTNTSSTNTHATVQVLSDKVRLKSAASGVWTTTNLMRSDYTTLTNLQTAVNAVSTWSCTLTSTYATYPTTELIQQPGRNAQNNTSVYLKTPELCETDYDIQDVGRAVLYNPFGWSRGHRNVFISYRAGYKTIPQGIQSVCQELVKLLYDKSVISASYEREQIGDYEYSVGKWNPKNIGDGGTLQSLSPTLYLKLLPYMRLLVG